MSCSTSSRWRLLAAASLIVAGVLHAQRITPAAPQQAAGAVPKTEEAVSLEAFNVTGTHLRRAGGEGALPMSVWRREALQLRDATTPAQLLGSFPQAVLARSNESNSAGAVARGDSATLSLRGLASGNTLVLLNGRRLASHPITQIEGGLPTSSVNVNQLPNRGVARVELLRDGASAVYGSDAVAGVVNTIMDVEFRGAELSMQAGVPEQGSGSYARGGVTFGSDFARGRGRIVAILDAFARTQSPLADLESSRDADKTRLAPPPFNLTTSAFFDRNTSGPFPSFRVGSATATQYFLPAPAGGMGFTTTAPARTGLTADYFFNVNDGQSALPSSRRFSGYVRGELDVAERITVFGELSYYDAFSTFWRAPIPYSSSVDRPLIIAADNPYNPFGSRFYHSAGAPNSDGTPRLGGTPQTVTILTKRLMDMGREKVEIKSDVVRLLAGARGRWGATWTWETAGYYTRARTVDEVQNAVRESALLAAGLRTDASAFNPFGYTFRVANGAVVAADPHVNSPAVMNALHDKLANIGRSSLASVDLRVSGSPFSLWSGPVSLASGAEFRVEQLSHLRPPFAGLNPPGSGLDETDNDFVQASPTSNIAGRRAIGSVYAEAVFPLAAPRKGRPLLHSLELTASGRHERYDDFGNTTKPKAGVNWRPFSWLLARASYNEGFRAPDLPLLKQRDRTLVQSFADGFRVDITGLVTDSVTNRSYLTGGNAALQPEFSRGKSAGLSLTVPGTGLTISADYWQIRQRNIIESDSIERILASDRQLLLAETQRQLAAGTPLASVDLGSGTSGYRGDPRVTRAAVPPADRAAFDAYNAARPAAERVGYFGALSTLRTAFSNRSAGYIAGADLGLIYQIPENALGRFGFATEWTYLEKGYVMAPGTNLRDNTVHQNGLARWRGHTHLTWRKGAWSGGVAGYYIGPWADTSASTTASVYEAAGRPGYIAVMNDLGGLNYYYRVASSLTFNASASYRFSSGVNRWMRNTTARLGVTNLTDRAPPFSSDTPGYYGAVHNYLVLGRTWTIELTRRF